MTVKKELISHQTLTAMECMYESKSDTGWNECLHSLHFTSTWLIHSAEIPIDSELFSKILHWFWNIQLCVFVSLTFQMNLVPLKREWWIKLTWARYSLHIDKDPVHFCKALWGRNYLLDKLPHPGQPVSPNPDLHTPCFSSPELTAHPCQNSCPNQQPPWCHTNLSYEETCIL